MTDLGAHPLQAAKLRPQAEVELGALRAVKQADTGDAADNGFYRWDSRFYDRIQKETALSIDESKVGLFNTARGPRPLRGRMFYHAPPPSQ